MSAPRLDPATRRRSVAKRRARRRLLVAGSVGLGAVVLVIALVAGGGGGKSGPVDTSQRGDLRAHTHARARLAGKHTTPRAGTPAAMTITQTGLLPAPVQDAAAAAIGPDRLLLIGGIDQGETSVADILQASPSSARRIGTLPQALHDASASPLAGAVYLFGGGVVSSFPQITRIDPSGATSPAGQLPTPGSDVATAALGGTVYVVGGYTGVTPLRTILAWRPGTSARVVAILPKPLRYAAVAASGGKLTIAGGTSGEEAGRDIYRFDPASGSLARIGLLPHPLTHAGAAALGGTVYVFGGREASPTSQTRRILAIEPDGEVRGAGLLPKAMSDLAAVALGERIVLIGGRDGTGATQSAILTAKPS